MWLHLFPLAFLRAAGPSSSGAKRAAIDLHMVAFSTPAVVQYRIISTHSSSIRSAEIFVPSEIMIASASHPSTCVRHICVGGEAGRGRGAGGGLISFVACLSHLTIDHAFLSKKGTVPTPNRDTSNNWALFTLFPYLT